MDSDGNQSDHFWLKFRVVPALNSAFSFKTITLAEYLAAMGLALAVIPVVEIEKAVRRRILRKGSPQKGE